MTPNRRTVIVGLGSGIAGIVGVNVLSQKSKAAELTVDELGVNNHTEDIHNSVNRVDLTVSGEYKYDTDIVPDKLILRLEAKRGEDYTQLNFIEKDTDLSSSDKSSYEMAGNLLDLPLVEHDDVNPPNVGDTKELSLDVRVSFTVRNNGREIHHKEVTDSFTLTINKTTASVNSTIEGTGNVSVITD